MGERPSFDLPSVVMEANKSLEANGNRPEGETRGVCGRYDGACSHIEKLDPSSLSGARKLFEDTIFEWTAYYASVVDEDDAATGLTPEVSMPLPHYVDGGWMMTNTSLACVSAGPTADGAGDRRPVARVREHGEAPPAVEAGDGLIRWSPCLFIDPLTTGRALQAVKVFESATTDSVGEQSLKIWIEYGRFRRCVPLFETPPMIQRPFNLLYEF